MQEKKSQRERQLNSVREIKNKYNSDATDILHEAQQKFNEELIKERESDHRTYKAIEAEGKELLRKAHKEGEIHIHERHNKTASIFYFSNKKLMLWENGEKHDLGYCGNYKKEPLAMNMLIVSDYVDSEEDLATIIIGQRNTSQSKNGKFLAPTSTFYIWRYRINNNSKKPFLHHPQIPSDKSNTWDLLMPLKDNGVTLNRSGPIIMGNDNLSYLGKKDKKQIISFPIRLPLSSRFPPKFVCREREQALDFYVIHEDNIVQIPSNDQKEINIINKGKMGEVVDLAYYNFHNSLLLQDAEKREIGLHLLDEPKERIWRSFGPTACIPIPKKSFNSTDALTISCLLKGSGSKNLECKPNSKSALKVWFEKELVNIEYPSNGKYYQYSFLKKNFFPNDENPSWFQFTVQMEKNDFRFLVDGVLIHSCTALDFLVNGKKQEQEMPVPIDLSELVNWSFPGYMLCELRIWNVIRTPKQLRTYSRTWLPVTEHDGLTGYWHFYVVGVKKTGLEYEHINKEGKIELIQEPDLSGHGNHFVTQKAVAKSKFGDLNYHTLVIEKAKSPFPKIIPLYDLKIIKQGLEIDENTGKIYWIDEGKDGRTYMTCGSTLGHTPPIQLFEINSDSDFAVLSQVNSPYESLILAHAERREAMEEKFNKIVDAHKEGHQDVQKKHKELLSTLNKSLSKEKQKKTKESKEEYTKVHQEWLQAIDHMNKEQENLIKASKISRETAIKKAKEMTDKAQHTIIENRKTTSTSLTDSGDFSQ